MCRKFKFYEKDKEEISCINVTYVWHYVNLPQREKMYLLTCAPNEDSNQSAHPCSLNRVFVVCINKICILVYPYCSQ